MVVVRGDLFPAPLPMTLPSPLYPAFRKRTPYTRATRIRRDLLARSSTRYPFTRRPDLILQDILSLLTRKSASLAARLQTLQDLLGELPAWTDWPPRAHSVVSSTVQGLRKEGNEEEKGKDALTDKIEQSYSGASEQILANELIRLNGGVEFIDERTFENKDPSLPLIWLEWLTCVQSPNDPNCHVRDDEGEWQTLEDLRYTIGCGGRLHIPSRTLFYRVPRAGASPALQRPPRKLVPSSSRKSALEPPDERRGSV